MGKSWPTAKPSHWLWSNTWNNILMHATREVWDGWNVYLAESASRSSTLVKDCWKERSNDLFTLWCFCMFIFSHLLLFFSRFFTFFQGCKAGLNGSYKTTTGWSDEVLELDSPPPGILPSPSLDVRCPGYGLKMLHSQVPGTRERKSGGDARWPALA